MSNDTCACDMRHPDDDSPFRHHPNCIAGKRQRETGRGKPHDPDEAGSDPDWSTYV